MIYEVFIDNKQLYYPGDEKLVIYNSKLEQALNDAGTFEFTITKNNPLYDEIYPRVSSVRITKNDTEIFFGQVRTSEEVLDGEKDVSCVGELSFCTIQYSHRKGIRITHHSSFSMNLLQIIIIR